MDKGHTAIKGAADVNQQFFPYENTLWQQNNDQTENTKVAFINI